MQTDQAAVYAQRKRILLDARFFISNIYYQSVYFNTKKELSLIDKVASRHISKLEETKNQIASEKYRQPYTDDIKKLMGIRAIINELLYNPLSGDDPNVRITFVSRR